MKEEEKRPQEHTSRQKYNEQRKIPKSEKRNQNTKTLKNKIN